MSINEWWRGAAIYQIYPRSFQDTNNDGIGDLPGIIQRLDYIASLNVDAVWISPFFKSPMKDFGYDVSDYCAIDPIFGTMEDFDTLLEKAHEKGIKIIIDLVLSHTSDQHPWFKDPAKKDWYVWADALYDADGKREPPNNWVSLFGGGAWEWCEAHQQYYFHNFLKEQPDLNFHNPEVQDEVLNLMRFWLDKGVDGFRLDVVNFYFHDQELRDNPPRNKGASYATQYEEETPYSAQQHIYDKSRPENISFLTRMRSVCDEYQDRFLIGEIGDDFPNTRAREYTFGSERLHSCYNTHMMSGTHKHMTRDTIEEPLKIFFQREKESGESAITCDDIQPWFPSWPSWAFSNHDVVRAASRWNEEYTSDPRQSTMLIALLGCLPGTIFIYQGEELGLAESRIPFEALQDPWAKQTWPEWQGRDGCRTPMPWNHTKKHASFSLSDPWLPVETTHIPLSTDVQNSDNDSCLNFTRNFLKWRTAQKTLVKGNYQFLDTNNENIIEILRKYKNYETRCIFNLSDQEQDYKGSYYPAYAFHIDGLVIQN